MLNVAANIDSLSDRKSGLLWSEWCFLLGVLAAALWIVYPSDPALRAGYSLKKIPFMLTVLAALVTLMGRRTGIDVRPRPTTRVVVEAVWPFLALAAIITVGSLYTRLIEGISSTFLLSGLYMLLTFFTAQVVMETGALRSLMKYYMWILLLSSVFMASVVVGTDTHYEYHNSEFLISPMAIYFLAGPYRLFWRYLGFFAFVAVALAANKNTFFICTLITIFYAGWCVWMPQVRKRLSVAHQALGIYVLVLGTALTLCAAAYVIQHREHYLPSGNPEFRTHLYETAWERFEESPLWGTLYASSTMYEFTLFELPPEYRTPSGESVTANHSDILDVLAHGGCLGAGLWLYGLYKIRRASYRSLLRATDVISTWSQYGHVLTVICLSTIATYAFNPLWIEPITAYFVWANLGVLLGLALRRDQDLKRHYATLKPGMSLS